MDDNWAGGTPIYGNPNMSYFYAVWSSRLHPTSPDRIAADCFRAHSSSRTALWPIWQFPQARPLALDWNSLEKGTWMDIVHHCTILIHTVAMNCGIGLTTELWGLSWRIPSAHLKLFKTWPEICNSYWLVVSKTVFPSESTRNDNTNWRIFEASPYKFLALGCYPIIGRCIVASLPAFTSRKGVHDILYSACLHNVGIVCVSPCQHVTSNILRASKSIQEHLAFLSRFFILRLQAVFGFSTFRALGS